MSITIREVAELSGFSIATVSHVINKTRYVSPEVTDKVLYAIKELNYYPNLIVRSLRNKKTNTIGLIMPSISNEMYGALAENIQKILFHKGYSLILCNTSYDPILEIQALNTFIMKKADAIIIIPVNENNDKLIEIQGMNIPVLLVDRTIKDLSIDTVRVDNFKGEYEAVNYLIKLGHKHIGYIDRKVDLSHSIEQREGYYQALKDNNIPIDDKNVIRANGYYYKSGIETVKDLVYKNPKITAISCFYDVLAFGAMRGLLDLGYKIPDDFSIIGFDGMPFTEATTPRLTTMFTSVKDIAIEACRIVLDRLDQKDLEKMTDNASSLEAETVLIKPELIIRESTGPAKN